MNEKQKSELVEVFAKHLHVTWALSRLLKDRVLSAEISVKDAKSNNLWSGIVSVPSSFMDALIYSISGGYCTLSEHTKEVGRAYARDVLKCFDWFSPKKDPIIHSFKILPPQADLLSRQFSDDPELQRTTWEGPVVVIGFGDGDNEVYRREFPNKEQGISFIQDVIWGRKKVSEDKDSLSNNSLAIDAEFLREQRELLRKELLENPPELMKEWIKPKMTDMGTLLAEDVSKKCPNDNSELVLRALLKGLEVDIGDHVYRLGDDLDLQCKVLREDSFSYIKLPCELSAFIQMCRKQLTKEQRLVLIFKVGVTANSLKGQKDS